MQTCKPLRTRPRCRRARRGAFSGVVRGVCADLVRVVVAAASLGAPLAWADPIQGARTAALGGTTLADPTDNAAITSSPAVLGLSSRYDIAAQGSWAPLDGNLEGSTSILDSREAKFTLGVAYRYHTWDAPLTDADMPGWTLVNEEVTNRKRAHDVGLALAIPVKKDVFSVGVNGAIAFTLHDRQSTAIWASPGVGLAWQPKRDVVLAASARGLVPGRMQTEQPLVAGLGFRARSEGLGSVRLEGDWQTGDGARPWSVRAGLEKEFGEAGRFRLGYRDEGPAGLHVLGVGVGIDNASGSVDLGLDLPFGAWSATTVRLGIRIFT
jgi:hypothetical protein